MSGAKEPSSSEWPLLETGRCDGLREQDPLEALEARHGDGEHGRDEQHPRAETLDERTGTLLTPHLG